MRNVIILGSGKIGGAIAKLLFHSGDYTVAVADQDAASLQRLKDTLPIETIQLDVTNEAQVVNCLQGRERVISACPYFLNTIISRAALEAGVSYFDLTEDVSTSQVVMDLASQAREGQVFMPQCGLAPGFISILAHDLCSGFDSMEKVKMRVGALPQYPSNMMLYNLTWSTDGLINEYCNPCEAISDGKMTQLMPLGGLELFSLDGVNYEAFNTSGGLGTLCETLKGKVKELNYKTVRYQGHQYLMRFLINSLNLGARREILKDILEKAVPITMQDVVLTFCTVSGQKDGQLLQVSDARKIYNQKVHGEQWSSIQITTAAGICAVVDLQAEGRLAGTGFICQESVPLSDFLNNRFGKYYRTESANEESKAAIEPVKEIISS